MDEKLGREAGTSRKLITFVKDRAGHDMRYAIDATKIKEELGWEPSVTFEQGMNLTIDWYLSSQQWMDNITSGDYQKYYEEQYKKR
jgi:dTDP-glucose 4,6-dehydratase